MALSVMGISRCPRFVLGDRRAPLGEPRHAEAVVGEEAWAVHFGAVERCNLPHGRKRSKLGWVIVGIICFPPTSGLLIPACPATKPLFPALVP